MASGGYRKPEHPAAVSGPGALSQRTDGGPADKQPMRALPDAKYGEQKDFQEIQAGAPMEQAAMPPPIPLSAPSGRPDEPVTMGADAGAGAGSSILGIPNPDQADLEALLPYLPVLEFIANQPGAAPSTRAAIRRIKSQI